MDAAVETFDTEAVAQALDKVPLEGWLIALVLLVAGIAVVRVLMTFIKRTLGRLPIDRALSAFLISCAQIALYVVLGTIIADQLGLPVTSLVVLLSLFALAISLSIQNVLANVVGGVVILTAKPFTAGDYIETDKGQGEVESVDLMYTHLATPDGKLVLIPNRELSAERITNFSRHPLRRMDISVRVGYEHENARVTAALLRAAAAMPDVVREGKQAPFATVTEYGETGVQFLLRVWTPTGRYWDVYYLLLDAVRMELARDGIALACGMTRVQVEDKGERR